MTTNHTTADTGKNSFRNLLILLVVYITISPFLIPYQALAVFAHIILSVALFLAVYTISKQKNQRSYATGLMFLVLVVYWLGIHNVIEFSRAGSYLLLALYFALLIYTCFKKVMFAKKVTITVLYVTFCQYLIIGLFWGALYALLQELSPGSYTGGLLENAGGGTLHIFNYFSMVTLTTLGYGDITPQTPGAAAFCQMEAIIGQFFTAVVIAWLMGLFLSGRESQQEQE